MSIKYIGDFSILNFLFGKRKKGDDNSFRVMLIIITLGLFALIAISWWAWLVNRKMAFGGVLGLSVIVGLASLMSGGLLGFLFGIPRSLQNSDAGATPQTGKEGQRFYSNNTNLEQISDWLTKIIVGVSLTQLPAIQNQFNQLALNVSHGFDKYILPEFSYPLACGIMIFYAICGFLVVYLWAKIYLLQQLTEMENSLYSRTLKKVNKLEIARLSNMISEYNRTKARTMEFEAMEPYASAIAVAQPAPIKFIDDSQKERWGGKSEIPGYKLDAFFKRNSAASEQPYQITLKVQGTDPAHPLTGDVYFFLHDSFAKEYLMTATAQNNEASVSFGSFEAFTIAALANGGAVKLELDLNMHPDAPENYKYSSPLLTFEDVKKELEELKAQ